MPLSALTWRRDLTRPLTALEFDGNTDNLDGRLTILENNPPEAVSIDTINLSGDQLTFVMTDATSQGPFTVPVVTYISRGDWAPSTAYAKYDTFTINGALYLVITAHTSAGSFDPDATDGMGHNLYQKIFDAPSNSLPDGGLTRQVLQKTSDANYVTDWGWVTAYDVTFSGGTDSSLISDNLFDALIELEGLIHSVVVSGHNVTFSPSTDSTLIATNVSDAIEELEQRIGTPLTSSDIGVTVQAFDEQLSSLVRQNSQSTAYTTVLTDGGKHIYHPSGDNNARTFTIDSNANVAYPVGTTITFVNEINTVTIAITSDTLVLAGTGSTGSRTLAANGIATALKVGTTRWVISGTGLT